MPLVNFSNLDFDQIKVSIRDYLKTNSNFTDYDFEGSNLSTIIDTLAYNTYISSYNSNMVSNEVFIDSATLRENVVSLARNIGYVPRARKSAKGTISFEVDVSGSNVSTVTLQPGIVATSNLLFGKTSFVFSVLEEKKVTVNTNGIAVFQNIPIYEGTYIKQSFTVSSRTPNQKYTLTNTGVDTSLLKVIVKRDQSSSVSRVFRKFDSLYDVNSQTPCYFLQEVENERYELLFGDGIFGMKLSEESLSYIEATYIVSSGELGNNISEFSFAGQLLDQNDAAVTTGISVISTESATEGGSNIESVESIKKYATQIYSSKNRAVTASDYEALVPQIYPETESVSAFGGENLSPPIYGKVFVSVKPYNGTHISSSIKRSIANDLKKYSVAGIVPEIIDLKYLWIETTSNVYYNTNLAPGADFVKAIVLKNILNYSKSSQLNKFGGRFKYSKFQKVIDDSHESVTSNITTVDMRRDLEAALGQFGDYEVCFGNRFYIKNHGKPPVMNNEVIGYNIRSSGFKVSGLSDTLYLGDIPNADLKTGSLLFFKLNSPTEVVIVKKGVGTIDYIKGEIKLSAVKFIFTEVNRGTPLIEISATPYSNDVIGLQDLYLQLDMSNVDVSMVDDRISSGNDNSGSNYLVKSSYEHRLVRGNPIYTSSIK
tara:strand:- start:1451 stop:3415 length:1965 start_codon:yes stop_codon:yes gene_type:complete